MEDSRNARLDLGRSKKPHFVSAGQGLSLGYRRNKTAGTWVYRKADGQGGMHTKAIGIADDFVEADGEEVLSYWQAVDKVRELGKPAASIPGPITVQQAFDNYLPGLEAKTLGARAPRRDELKSTSYPAWVSSRWST